MMVYRRAIRSSLHFRGQATTSTCSLWDLSADAGNRRKPLLTSPESLAFGADGKEALALDWDNSNGTVWCRRHQPAGGAWHDTRLALPDWSGFLAHPLFSPDLRRLVAGGPNFSPQIKAEKRGELWFWDTATGKIMGKPVRFSERNNWIFFSGLAVFYAFRPDSRALAVAIVTMSETTGSDGKRQVTFFNPRLQLLDVSSARVLKEFKLSENPQMIAFNPRGDLLVCVGTLGALELRDAKTGDLRGPRVPMKGATSAAFSGDGKRLFVGKSDGTAELWELDALLNPAEK